MVLRLWVPLSHRLLARNWNRAASGAVLTASRVANRAAVSTPLRADVSVVVMSGLLRSGGGELVLAWGWAGGQFGRLGVEGVAELPLQLDELGYRWVFGQRAGQLEDLLQRPVTLALVTGQSGVVVGVAAQRAVQRDG